MDSWGSLASEHLTMVEWRHRERGMSNERSGVIVNCYKQAELSVFEFDRFISYVWEMYV